MSPSSLDLYTQHEQSQEALIVGHMAMVKRVASHLKARIPPYMELDELVQVGMIGLIEAARAFDTAKGVGFENFALSRIRGAMLDEVRRLSSLPRSAVAFKRSENDATQTLAAELGRKPSTAELADFMGKTLDTYHKEKDSAHRFETYSMEDIGEEVLNIRGDREQQPEVYVEQAQFMAALTDAIDGLSERPKLVMSLYYVEELNLKEIGEVLGVSESRVSQILSETVKKLRNQLQLD
ncbi:MAG: polymerase sigma factor FliA [Pseudomonadota bacterium]|jgi:RNA polymerase sigma factor for flagellar operon FliA